MKDNMKHSYRKQVRQGLHPNDPGTGLSGIAKHRAGLSTNRSAVGGTVGDAAFRTGAIDLGETSQKYRDASHPRRYSGGTMDADYRRQ